MADAPIGRHDPADEILCPQPFDFSFESEESTEGMRRLIVSEVRAFRKAVRTPISQKQDGGSNNQR